MPILNFDRFQVKFSASHHRPTYINWARKGVPGTQSPTYYAQSIELEQLFQDLFSYIIKKNLKKKLHVVHQKCICPKTADFQSNHPPLTTCPEVGRGSVTAFLTRLDPIVMRNRQLSTSSFRICYQIKKIFILTCRHISSK